MSCTSETLEFPEKISSVEELKAVIYLIKNGYKHCLKLEGNSEFKSDVAEALSLIKSAQYYNFLRTYIRRIILITGLSQLRETEATVWTNKHTFSDSIEGAGFLIQKAQQMRDYIEGNPFFGGLAEAKTVKKRIEFLESLKEKNVDPAIQEKCLKALKAWNESHIGTL